MTSPQWFESVSGAFTSQSFVDCSTQDGAGLLIAHSGSQQWFRTEAGLANVLLAMDPWDGDNQDTRAITTLTLTPHRGLTNAECIRRSSRFRGFGTDGSSRYKETCGDSDSNPSAEGSPFPRDFSAVTSHHPGVLATAFYREQGSFAGRGVESYAGKGIEHPYILRLVEANGEEAEAEITLAGPIATAYKTNLLGEIIEAIPVAQADSKKLTSEPEKLAAFGIEAASLKVHLKPYEIATLYLDIVPGRKQFRDLDAKREIWATVHRTE